MVLGGTWSVWVITVWYLVVLGQYRAALVGTWCYWDSMKRYWLALGGKGSVRGGTAWYMVVLSQYNSVMLSIKLYWVSKVRVCLYILGKMEIWSGDTDALQTDRQQKIELLSFYKV